MFSIQARVSQYLTSSGGTRSVGADWLRRVARAVQRGNGLSHVKVDPAARIANEALDLAFTGADRPPVASFHKRLALRFRDSSTRDAIGIMKDDLFRHGYSVDLLRMD